MPISPEGLTGSQVKNLQSKFGFNELPIKDKSTLLKLTIKILIEPMFGLLIVAGLIYLVIGNIEDALILLGFIAISISITIFQQRKSEKQLRL